MDIFRVLFTVIFSLWWQGGSEICLAAEGINFLDFLMSSSSKNNHKINFSPDDGRKFRKSFEQKYGTRGKLLIDSMGQGSPHPFATVPTATTTSIPKAKKNGTTKHVVRIKKRIISTTTLSPSSSSTTTGTTSSGTTSTRTSRRLKSSF